MTRFRVKLNQSKKPERGLQSISGQAQGDSDGPTDAEVLASMQQILARASLARFHLDGVKMTPISSFVPGQEAGYISRLCESDML
jgi:hypothetical protein